MNTVFERFFPCWLWLLLALPGLGMASDLATSTSPRVYRELLSPTGEFAARFMIIAMLASPLVLLLRDWRGPRWLRKNRRYFGVAAFAYAAAVLALLHWAALDGWNGVGPALVHFGPLVLLEAYRAWYWVQRPILPGTV